MLSLLPGLEEETSEDFDRTLGLVDKMRASIQVRHLPDLGADQSGGNDFFWQSFFLATITSSSRRQGALAYLVRRLPKLGNQKRRTSVVSNGDAPQAHAIFHLSRDAYAVVSPEPGLLIRCFASGLADPQILIQRGFLDLLVTHLPLDSIILQQKVNAKDLELLVGAAVGVVTRRDMSLNRRLWAWLLGPEPLSDIEGANEPASAVDDTKISATALYFTQNGFDPLRRYLHGMIKHETLNPTERARPFRLCLSLMDRWEVGGLLVTDIFAPAMRSAYLYSQVGSSEEVDEVQRSANIFFDGVESGLIWGEIVRLIAAALSDTNSQEAINQLKLVKFVVTKFNIREEEMLVCHIPTAALALLSMVHQKALLKASITSEQQYLALSIAECLLDMVPERAFQLDVSNEDRGTSIVLSTSEQSGNLLGEIRHFYTQGRGNLGFNTPPISSKDIGPALLGITQILLNDALNASDGQVSIEELAKILSVLVSKMRHSIVLQQLNLFSSFRTVLLDSLVNDQKLIASFSVASSISGLLMSLHRADALRSEAKKEDAKSIVLLLVNLLWWHLSPTFPKHHVESVRHIRQLETIIAPTRIIEAVVTSAISGLSGSPSVPTKMTRLEAARRFGVLWVHGIQLQGARGDRTRGHHRSSSVTLPGDLPVQQDFSRILTRPLLLLLDSLADKDSELYDFVSTWLRSLPSVSEVFLVLVRGLRSLNVIDRIMNGNPDARADAMDGDVDDNPECLHLLHHLHRLVEVSSEQIWITLAGATITISKRKSDDSEVVSLQAFLVQMSLQILNNSEHSDGSHTSRLVMQIRRTALQLLQQIFAGPYASPLRELEVENPLLEMLIASVEKQEPDLQPMLLDLILSASRLRVQDVPHSVQLRKHTRANSVASRISFQNERTEDEQLSETTAKPPSRLIECIRLGFTSPSSRFLLDHWVNFLTEALVIYEEAIFQNLIPLIESFCKQISTVFSALKPVFAKSSQTKEVLPETTLISLLNGLEQILARAHERLLTEEAKSAGAKSPDQPQSFFGNMVTGFLSPEITQNRSPSANNRLAVLLSFQDTVRITFSIWSWAGYNQDDNTHDASSSATFGYTSLRMRNRARRTLEHLFAAEPLECLETLAMIWCASSEDQKAPAFGLLHVLDGSRPKNTTPAIFNAIYGRTNPHALEQTRITTLTSKLSDVELVGFLIGYTKSIEDDAMDEIWPDCMTFLRDVLANPMPHRQILPGLLEFTVVLAQKLDNTSFGDQRRMRRELSDLFTRLLTATFTTRGSVVDLPSSLASDKPRSQAETRSSKSLDVVEILASAIPKLGLILETNDRIAAAGSSICTSVLNPMFRSKNYPENVPKAALDLLCQLTRIPQSAKSWKREVNEAFNDSRFFASPLEIIESGWMPILRQLSLNDKDRVPDLLSRISSPTTAGIVFGVGAVSARLETDRRSQLNLRRVALLVMASEEDSHVQHLPLIQEKLVDLLAATPTSSPSSATRADVYILVRALILRTSPTQLASFWPVLNSELHAVLSSLLPETDSQVQETFNASSLLQACRLLDLLITIAPDDFQLLEWLYVTDTIDAVYRPSDWHPTALVDEISDELGSLGQTSPGTGLSATQPSNMGGKRRMLLEVDNNLDVKKAEKSEIVVKLLRPWFGHLSIAAFEGVYGMGNPDIEHCEKLVLRDICDDGSIV
ncbi:MAG: hypothetical protein M1822_005853 [Bathelium mastoideum]|nr:MAG: hypothetical protein M1822_005853 [Bathelium mastoideum]